MHVYRSHYPEEHRLLPNIFVNSWELPGEEVLTALSTLHIHIWKDHWVKSEVMVFLLLPCKQKRAEV